MRSGSGSSNPGGRDSRDRSAPSSGSPLGPSPRTSPQGPGSPSANPLPVNSPLRNGATPQRAQPSLALLRDPQQEFTYNVNQNGHWLLVEVMDARQWLALGYRVYNSWDGNEVTEFTNAAAEPNPQHAFTREYESIDRIRDAIEYPDEQPRTPTKDHRSPPGSGGRRDNQGPGSGSRGAGGGAGGVAA